LLFSRADFQKTNPTCRRIGSHPVWPDVLWKTSKHLLNIGSRSRSYYRELQRQRCKTLQCKK
jgi:hypothetical protein